MKTLNFLLTLSSLNVILVTIERFSFTTKIVLQPYSFLRLHEVVQIITLILFTVIIPFFLLKEITGNFGTLKTTKGTLLGLAFIIGVYFYATGNGIHELASYLFNTFCPIKNFSSLQCQSMYFNDYYFGNILYFTGAFLMNTSLLIFERIKPNINFSKKDLVVTSINSLVLAFAVFAYAAFDRVLVGIVYSMLTMITVYFFLFTWKKKYIRIPFTFYIAIAYTIGTLASILVRFIR